MSWAYRKIGPIEICLDLLSSRILIRADVSRSIKIIFKLKTKLVHSNINCYGPNIKFSFATRARASPKERRDKPSVKMVPEPGG